MELHVLVCLLVLQVSAVLGIEQLQYFECGKHAIVRSAVLVPTERDVNGAYIVRENNNYTLTVNFQPLEIFRELQFRAMGILGNGQEFELAIDRNPCNTELNCPLHPGQAYTYAASTQVFGLTAELTTFEIKAKLFDFDTGREVFCLSFAGHASLT